MNCIQTIMTSISPYYTFVCILIRTHKERAQRECEKLLLVEQLEQKKIDDRHHWEELVTKSEESNRAQHEAELEEKKRLARMASARVC
jgi:hypothetical protein